MKRILMPISCLLLSLTMSCGDGKTPEETENETPNTEKTSNPSAGGNLAMVQNQLFSIPSPVQTAILIRKQNIEFDQSLVCDLDKIDAHVNNIDRALDLGVLGADLAYLSNYEDFSMSLNYLKKMESTAELLNVKAEIDPLLLKRFNENINNSDSVNMLNSEFYTNMERYLKDNAENESLALILTGGWVESMHFATENSSNKFLRARLGEQKSTVMNLCKMIGGAFESDKVNSIVSELKELEKVYASISVDYKFEKPIADPSEKMTYLKSRSSVQVSDDNLERIKESISKIRNTIIS